MTTMGLAQTAPRGGGWRLVLLAGLLLLLPQGTAQDAATLRARHAELSPALASNAFQRPLHVASQVGHSTLRGDIHARFEQPFAVLGPALQAIGHWCDILILHPNVKGCRVLSGGFLRVHLGRKIEQPLDKTQPIIFRFRVLRASADYLQLALDAERGPLGTSDYHMTLELAALDARRSFLRLSYAHAYGLRASLAMQGYLMSGGRNKLGFTIVGRGKDGQPIYVGGMRGAVERNVMRYYLAIEAFLDALAVPAAEREERRLHLWHAGASRYPRQLQEPALDDYLEVKRREIRRQQLR